VVYFGLNDKIGNISYYDSTGQQEYSFQKPFSEKTAEIIDQEIKKLIDKAYERAVKILKANRDKLEVLAGILLEKEVIFGEDLERIFGKKIQHHDHTIVVTNATKNGTSPESEKTIDNPAKKKRGRPAKNPDLKKTDGQAG
jgi:cell division protease FtsH